MEELSWRCWLWGKRRGSIKWGVCCLWHSSDFWMTPVRIVSFLEGRRCIREPLGAFSMACGSRWQAFNSCLAKPNKNNKRNVFWSSCVQMWAWRSWKKVAYFYKKLMQKNSDWKIDYINIIIFSYCLPCLERQLSAKEGGTLPWNEKYEPHASEF